MNLFIPKNLKIEDLLTEKYAFLRVKKRHIQRMYGMVELILRVSIIHGKNRCGWVQIHTRKLERIFSRKFVVYRDALVEAGIIECCHKFSAGHYCKKYRLAKEYLTGNRAVRITDKVFAKKIKARENYKCTVNLKNKIHEKLYNWLKKVSIDKIENSELLDINQAKLVSMIKRKKFYMYCDKYGRLHSNITNLKKVCRKNLKIDGKSLIQIDIKNSQPLLFNILINKLLDKGIIQLSNDIKLYRELTMNGTFYEYCAELYKIKDEKGFKLLKPRLFRHVFFGKKTAVKFAKYFPEVVLALEYLKKNNYKNLARRLQKIEAKLIINKICGRITKEYPDVPILTIHDCILTTEDHTGCIYDIIEDEFLKIGLDVSV